MWFSINYFEVFLKIISNICIDDNKTANCWLSILLFQTDETISNYVEALSTVHVVERNESQYCTCVCF